MKVLGISCSPRRGGNTEILVGEALAGAKDYGADVELVLLCDKNITPCDGCDSCTTTGKCRIEDDMQALYSKLLEADGVIFGTPVYFWSVTAQAKILIDRSYAFRQGRRLRNKVAGVVVVAHRTGASHAFSVFHNFINIHRMISAAGALAYGSEGEIGAEERGGGAVAYAGQKGEVKQDKRGMTEAKILGSTVAKTVDMYKKSRLL